MAGISASRGLWLLTCLRLIRFSNVSHLTLRGQRKCHWVLNLAGTRPEIFLQCEHRKAEFLPLFFTQANAVASNVSSDSRPGHSVEPLVDGFATLNWIHRLLLHVRVLLSEDDDVGDPPELSSVARRAITYPLPQSAVEAPPQYVSGSSLGGQHPSVSDAMRVFTGRLDWYFQNGHRASLVAGHCGEAFVSEQCVFRVSKDVVIFLMLERLFRRACFCACAFVPHERWDRDTASRCAPEIRDERE